MKCLNCGKEVESKGTKPVKYCSNRCRMIYKRTERTEQTNKPIANEQVNIEMPLNYGLDDCQCIHCKQCRGNELDVTLWHDTKPVVIVAGVTPLKRVSLPGDIDYKGVCVKQL
jgi:endogenous inhibitor of DNA gyrase (YacG/DUF329 family)